MDIARTFRSARGPCAAVPSARSVRPAASAQTAVFARCAAAMRGAVGVAACAAALLAEAPHPAWWVAVVANAAWTAVFVAVALRHGVLGALALGDAALTALLCLAQRWILPASALSDGVSWVAVMVTTSMVVLNIAYSPGRAAPACLALLLCHLLGARWAGAVDGGGGSAFIQSLQIVALALVMTLIRRAARLTDDVMAGLRLEQQVSAAAGTRRREEAARSDELHTTVLATLTVVATGGFSASTPLLRRQATVAAGVLTALGPDAAPGGDAVPDGSVDLARRLRQVADGAPVRVAAALVPMTVPAVVAEAVAGAVEEALVNVGRHAGTGEARLELEGTGAALRVEVSDEGVGFDPAAVASHRYGTRHAVVAAVRRAGGEAVVDSTPGAGTRVILRWPT
jgi:Histidine kinase-, DNA gyrase B-, and HSP90-like ATPase